MTHPNLPRKRHGLALAPEPWEQELMPGDVALGHRGHRLKTLLGSCVAVVLTDPHLTVATMCHMVHHSKPNPANLHNTAYGICAMDRMFHMLRHVGLAPSQCMAFVYGGGNMFPQLGQSDHVGARNVQWALAFLSSHHIPIKGQSTGASAYRKLVWTVGSTEPELVVTDVEAEANHGY